MQKYTTKLSLINPWICTGLTICNDILEAAEAHRAVQRGALHPDESRGRCYVKLKGPLMKIIRGVFLADRAQIERGKGP